MSNAPSSQPTVSRLFPTLLSLTLVGVSMAAESATSEGGDAPKRLERAAPYQVGPGDLLEVTLSEERYLLTVQVDGTISLPTGKLKVKGLATTEVRRKVEAHLQEVGFSSVQPTVRVKEHRSQVAFITGEVLHPGRYYLFGNHKMFTILLRAGGFTRHASGEVIVQPADGGEVIRIDLSPDMTMREQRQALNIPLANGDSVGVTRKPQASESR